METNLQLEDLVTGEAAGSDAGKWSQTVQFGGSEKISKELTKTSNKIDKYYSSNGPSVEEISKKAFIDNYYIQNVGYIIELKIIFNTLLSFPYTSIYSSSSHAFPQRNCPDPFI